MTRVQQTSAATLFIAVLILGGWAWSQDAPVTSPSDLNPAIAKPSSDGPSTDQVDPITDGQAALPIESTGTSAAPLRQGVIASLTIFALAVFVGIEVISKVPPTLHTPLMSGSNAISGIAIVGAVIVASALVEGISDAAGIFARCLGFIAVTLAVINAVGGFLVTHRMLAMFARK
jgi:NAD(P) transhydrogenase subunit alpha